MSKTKHTPGPWQITGEYSNSQDEISSANGQCICVVWTRSPSNPYASARSQFRYNPELKANAERIVACVNACEGIIPEAVPLMLEALKDSLQGLHAAFPHASRIRDILQPIIEKAQNAISKATSET